MQFDESQAVKLPKGTVHPKRFKVGDWVRFTLESYPEKGNIFKLTKYSEFGWSGVDLHGRAWNDVLEAEIEPWLPQPEEWIEINRTINRQCTRSEGQTIFCRESYGESAYSLDECHPCVSPHERVNKPFSGSWWETVRWRAEDSAIPLPEAQAILDLRREFERVSMERQWVINQIQTLANTQADILSQLADLRGRELEAKK
jgi:hypothetical protein